MNKNCIRIAAMKEMHAMSLNYGVHYLSKGKTEDRKQVVIQTMFNGVKIHQSF